MTASTLKAARPITATFLAIAGGLAGLAAAFKHATPPDDDKRPVSHRRTQTPGGRAGTGSPFVPPAGPLPDELADAPWPEDDAATLQWARDMKRDLLEEPPLDPLPIAVVTHAAPDITRPGPWQPPAPGWERELWRDPYGQPAALLWTPDRELTEEAAAEFREAFSRAAAGPAQPIILPSSGTVFTPRDLDDDEPPTLTRMPAVTDLDGDRHDADRSFVEAVVGPLYTDFWLGPWTLEDPETGG